jgi:hypothetical protein
MIIDYAEELAQTRHLFIKSADRNAMLRSGSGGT